MLLKICFMTLIMTTESMSLQSSRTYSFTRPTIVNKEEAYDAEVGSNFNLTCQTYANDTEKINFDLSWAFSDQKDQRVFRDSAKKIANNLWLTKLYFTNVSYADEGGYNCTLRIGRLAQFNDSVILRVKSSQRQPERDVKTNVLTNDKKNFGDKNSYEIVPEKSSLPTEQNQSANPKFSKNQLSVNYGAPVNITCTVSGDPKASVSFSYKRCLQSKDCREENAYKVIPGAIRKSPVSPENTPSITYTIEAQFYSPGELLCTAKNVYGEWKATQHICVTDSPTGLSISEPDYHDHGVSITCEVSTCEYIGLPHWYYKSINSTIIKLPDRHVEYTRGPFYSYAEAIIENLTSGNAGVYICMAKTRTGGKDSVNINIEPKISPDQSYTLALSLSLAVITALAAGSMFMVIKYSRGSSKPEENELKYMPPSKVSEYFNPEIINKKWHFPSEKLDVKAMVGTGFFSHVYHADAKGISPHQDVTKVAVKTARDKSNFKEIWNEFKILERANSHPHIVNLLGVVVDTPVKYEIYLIVEYCRHGSLRKFLRANKGRLIKNREPTPFTRSDSEYYPPKVTLPKNIILLLSFAYQISRGMQWLSYRDVLHGDLAARNVLLADNNIVKICDFGLARVLKDNYVCQKPRDASVPLKWMAIECLESMEFSKESDVWAFGVVLWEIFSFGESPYAEFMGKESIYEFLMQGQRLEKPAIAPTAAYDLMLLCWNADPEERPSFSFICKKLSEMIPSSHLEYLFDLEEKYTKILTGITPVPAPASVVTTDDEDDDVDDDDDDDDNSRTISVDTEPESDNYATEGSYQNHQRY